ncbi:MAG TPA: hypothetical protein VG326_21035 [Tepidisphaeraceae bacterium]|jgi:hypothetical protein|nr:hypothetical protein [Tepidisphaeraceae bacterium]
MADRRSVGRAGVAARLPLSVMIFFTGAFSVRADEKPAVTWINVTANVGGEKWGYAGVTLMAAVPGSDQIIAGVSEAGLWTTTDSGKAWKKLGAKDAVAIQNRPYQIVFDPTDPKIFWESGNYKPPGVFKSTDGGATFVQLGNAAHVDGIGIDFTDPDRKTLLIGHHEQDRSIEKSVDGGQTWQKIGDKLPDHINFSSDVIVFDAKTFLVNAAGWKQENGAQLPFGIYRTEDAGATWTKVSDAGPSGPACRTSDGAIYWQTLWAAGLVKSVNQGKTWEKLPGVVKANPIEIADKKLVAPVEKQLYVSADGGKTWEKLGPEMPFKPNGIVYGSKVRAIYAWRSTEAKEDNVIARWDMP